MAPLYSRYIPSKAVQSQESDQPGTATADVSQATTVTTQSDPSNGRAKRKRNETDDTDRKAPRYTTSDCGKDNGIGNAVATEAAQIKKSKKKEDGVMKKKTESKAPKAAKSPKRATAAKEDQVMDAVESEVMEGAGNADHEDHLKPAKHTGVFSKFQKAAERSAQIQATAGDAEADGLEEPQPELHDLIPLPQPRREATPEYVPTFSALPDWLANPITVSQSTTKPFKELSLSSKTIAQLESKGWSDAFAVQAALLPLLLPHPYLTHLPPNDICVSAPTGSGKTLGYVLPIVEALRTRTDTKLRAVIVVPTRELVQQAQEVTAACAAGTRLRVATAVGNQNLAAEQQSLIRKGRTYDPEGYQKLMTKAKKRIHHQSDSDSEFEDFNNTLATAAKSAMLADVVEILPDHVPTYTSAVDILICTPGRLVEHMNSTVGFNLDDVEWLVIDEADRLLDQSFQEWVAKVVGALDRIKPNPQRDIIDRELPFTFQQKKDRYVRKVILSATMTRDISKLSALRLRRPSLVQVKSAAEDGEDAQIVKSSLVGGVEVYELPRTLDEHAVPVGDGLDKPLYLLQLLKTNILQGSGITPPAAVDDSSDDSSSSDEDDDSSDSSDSSSDDSSSSDESDSEGSESDDESDDSSSSSSSNSSSDSEDSSSNPSKTSSMTKSSQTKPPPSANPMVLVFTGSTEEAARLHHLLTNLEPAYKPLTTLLTKTSSNPTSKITSAAAGGPSIIISTDRASRGLDLPQLTHVVNYHMPRSVQTYVHRVGRTARAGRSGEAWTLFQENQGRWFWRDIARAAGSEKIARAGEMDRVNMKLADESVDGGAVRLRYEAVLGAMKDIVVQGQAGRKSARGKKGDASRDVEMAG